MEGEEIWAHLREELALQLRNRETREAVQGRLGDDKRPYPKPYNNRVVKIVNRCGICDVLPPQFIVFGPIRLSSDL